MGEGGEGVGGLIGLGFELRFWLFVRVEVVDV